jgi:hypothetical protein
VAHKEIVFDEGELRLRLPADWVETRETDGGRAFYDPARPGGTLRVKTMTFTTEENLGKVTALGQLEEMETEPGQTLEALPNGNALRVHRELTTGEHEANALHVWLLASIDPPHQMRLAVFSFTVSKGEEEAEVIAMLGKEIRQARFNRQLS